MKTLHEIDMLVAENVMGWKPDEFLYQAVDDRVADGAGYSSCGMDMPKGEALALCERMNRDAKERGYIARYKLKSSNVLPYSTDIAAAWEVVEKFAGAKLEHEYLEIFRCELDCGGASVHATASTAPLAICLAALIAHGIDAED